MAHLISFPQERNIGKARRVAAVYLGKRTNRAKASYWSNICSRLDAAMRRCGFSDAEIEQQIDAFRGLVERELGRLQNGHGGGAA